MFLVFLDFDGKTRIKSAIIKNNRSYLLENIQPNNDLLSSLLCFNCITEEQSNFIRRQRTERNKNAELLRIARSFDQNKSSHFVRCLQQTNQKTVARILDYGGGLL